MAMASSTSPELASGPIAVYCGSSTGTHRAYLAAATSLGRAMAASNRPLVYGGGSFGIMGTVSGAVLEGGGKVTGITPYAMVRAGGEGEKTEKGGKVQLNEQGREAVETVIVDSMHERKVEMAKRSVGFVGLPGGFGTFEEVLEAITWTQLGVHNKRTCTSGQSYALKDIESNSLPNLTAVVLVNVLGFWEPLRQLIKSSISAGFIKSENENITVFVDGPSEHSLHEDYDWGTATLAAVNNWQAEKIVPIFDWTRTRDGKAGDNFAAT
ncbi:hypothetical protein NMY22_g2224 [Coprinellus aureogranulatus]|nr:hypothetical protein NMY22_g2224 [Coprinellus aureogranulatus]